MSIKLDRLNHILTEEISKVISEEVKDLSLIHILSAYQILYNNCDKDDAYETYISLLEKHEIKDPRSSLEDMFILDYIMLNEDRHLNNFGIIRDFKTLNWISTAQIFDTGESLNIIDYSDEEVIINGDGRFFYNISNFDNILDNIKDL